VIGTPFGHQGQHGPFPVAEPLQWVDGAPPGDQRAYQVGVECELAAGYPVQRAGELGAVADPSSRVPNDNLRFPNALTAGAPAGRLP